MRRVIVVGVAAILAWTSVARAEQAPPRLKISASAVESVVQASIKAERQASVSAPSIAQQNRAALAQAGGGQTESWFQRNWKWLVPVVGAVAAVAIIAAAGGYDSDDGDGIY